MRNIEKMLQINLVDIYLYFKPRALSSFNESLLEESVFIFM